MNPPLDPSGQRTDQQIRDHYEIEKKLASQLMQANRKMRRNLYSELYEALYRSVPSHPMLTAKQTPEERRQEIDAIVCVIKPYLPRDSTFMEIGAGDCALSFEVAKHVKHVLAIDVSETISKNDKTPSNFELVLTDGTSIPAPDESIDVAYSNQLMEHLHPDDAFMQLQNIQRALVKGGKYICLTPNKIDGPHDVSMYFDEEATGFHLKEYTYGELRKIFRSAGFAKDYAIVGAKGKYCRCPTSIPILIEYALTLFPKGIRKKLASTRLLKAILAIRIVGVKGQ